MMKKIFLMVFLFLIVGCSKQPTFTDNLGNVVRFSNYQGKWIVLNYWATSCKACYRQVQELNGFYLAHKGTDAVVFGVSKDTVADNAQLNKLMQKIGAIFPTLTTNPRQALDLKPGSPLPVTYLIHPDGEVSGPLIGLQTKRNLEKMMESTKK